jgi:CRISPR-associated protein Cas2
MKHELARKNFTVVAYDISDDKRRTRLHLKLKRFGLAVQYSVFECLLVPDQVKAMKKMVRANIKTKDGDRVRYYHLCEGCRTRIEATDAITEQDAPAVFA